jgi:nucleotide-binding universal stress UspA family protein
VKGTTELDTTMKILVTLDGSHFSEAILGTVGKLARPLHAQVHLLSIAEHDQARSTSVRQAAADLAPVSTPTGTLLRVPLPADLVSPAAESRSQALARVDASLREYLEDRSKELENGDVTVSVGFAGDVAEAIIDHARREQVDLIAMATHGRTGLSHLLAGSVCERVIRSGVAPVLVLRP